MSGLCEPHRGESAPMRPNENRIATRMGPGRRTVSVVKPLLAATHPSPCVTAQYGLHLTRMYAVPVRLAWSSR